MKTKTTFIGAAIEVLRKASGPLTTEQVTEEALSSKLIKTKGKTPVASMSSVLYRWSQRQDSPIDRVYTEGSIRAKRDSVRWKLSPRGRSIGR